MYILVMITRFSLYLYLGAITHLTINITWPVFFFFKGGLADKTLLKEPSHLALRGTITQQEERASHPADGRHCRQSPEPQPQALGKRSALQRAGGGHQH